MTTVASFNARARYASMSPADKEARKAQMREYMKTYVPKNAQKKRKAAASSRPLINKRQWVLETVVTTKLSLASCVDCDLPCEDWNHVMFAFDHLDPTVKLFSLSKAYKVKNLTLEMLVNEMAKCELVCHNCHAFRTYIERAHDNNPRTEHVSGPEPLFEL